MPTYYVHIPDSEAPTAEVNASSTKHARTTYLDYLSRNSIISWRERQSTRGLVKVSRMQPGEIRTQVQLDYDMRPEPEAVMSEAPTPASPYEEEAVKLEPETMGPLITSRGEYREGETPQQRAGVVEQFIGRGGAPAPGPRLTHTEGGEQIDTRSGQSIPNPLTSSLTSSPIAKLSRKSKGV